GSELRVQGLCHHHSRRPRQHRGRRHRRGGPGRARERDGRLPARGHGRRARLQLDDRHAARAAAGSLRPGSARVRSGLPRTLLVLLALAVLFAIPRLTGNEYLLALGISFAMFSVLAGGLNLVYGYTGLLSFAQVGFLGIGGYTAALLVTERGWPLGPAAGAGGAPAPLVGLGLGYSPLRPSPPALPILWLGFAPLCIILALDLVP